VHVILINVNVSVVILCDLNSLNYCLLKVYVTIRMAHKGLQKRLLSTLNTQLSLSFIWLEDQLRMGSVPICHCDHHGVIARRIEHVLELNTSRIIRGHKGS